MVTILPSGVHCIRATLNTLISAALNGVPDGKIDSNDEAVIGYPQNYPFMIFGLTATANWKGFDLSLFFQGAGMTSYNTQNFYDIPFFNNNSNADYEYYNNHWTPR